jgi:type VI protein secretion system component Hcp
MAVDILMQIFGPKGAIAGEGQSTIDMSDPLQNDFVAGQFFEVDDFDFGIDVVDTDSASAPGDKTKDPKDTKKTGRFSKWIQGTMVTTGQGSSGRVYPIEMEPFSFSRKFDLASPTLFQNCFLTKPFVSATVVMRKTGGIGTKVGNIAFLRIDFTDVLIIAIDWDGGEQVKEKCKFVCRTVKVQYAQQKSDGTAMSPVGTGTEPLSLQKATDTGT